MPAQIKDNGVRVDLGGVEEFTWHCRWQFHQLLEQLINDPYAPNHLDYIADLTPRIASGSQWCYQRPMVMSPLDGRPMRLNFPEHHHPGRSCVPFR